MHYWFNVDTGTVETDETRSQSATVMGPYDTHDAASCALESARERTENWDAEDKAWEEGRSED
ncbi:MAG: methionine aminopeptidase [Ornithinibacter sp.]